MPSKISQEIILITRKLNEKIDKLVFDSPVAFTYNPLSYAWLPHVAYIEKYASSTKKNFFLGMNPGPFGMAQTGVPFGEINAVKNWLHIQGQVNQPGATHPKRPIQGFSCPKSEVSGKRLWGLFEQLYDSAEHFFETNFVANYCPLIWMSESGANITPDKLPAEKRQEVEQICDEYLKQLIIILNPDTLVGVGGYALKKLENIVTQIPQNSYQTGTILHPSPASPIANKLWPERPIEQLRSLGIIK